MDDTIHSRVAYLRKSAGISAHKASRIAGLTHSHFRQVESGERSQFTNETILSIADAFGVSMDWLSAGRGATPKAGTIRTAVAAAEARLASNAMCNTHMIARAGGAA